MQFQQDCPKSFPSRTLKYAVSAGLARRKKITGLLIFLAENLEKFRSTEHYGAPLEGSTIFFVAALWAVRRWKAVD